MSDAGTGQEGDASSADATIAFPDAFALDAPGLDATGLDAASLDAAPEPSLDAAPDRSDAGRCTTTMCGTTCVDTTRDLANCGGCGRICSLPAATASCVASRCTVASCEPGRGNCNGNPDDGCEASCTAGSACVTACGSAGTRACGDVCAPTCTPPGETCNARDDDCDGLCDEDLAGCREGVARAYHDTLGGHLYTRNRAEIAAGGFRTEQDPYFFVYPSPQAGLVPLHRCFLGRAHRLYTLDAGCEGAAATYEGILGYVATSAVCGARPLYRLGGVNNHFYAVEAAERDYAVSIGYVNEGITAYVW